MWRYFLNRLQVEAVANSCERKTFANRNRSFLKSFCTCKSPAFDYLFACNVIEHSVVCLLTRPMMITWLPAMAAWSRPVHCLRQDKGVQPRGPQGRPLPLWSQQLSLFAWTLTAADGCGPAKTAWGQRPQPSFVGHRVLKLLPQTAALTCWKGVTVCDFGCSSKQGWGQGKGGPGTGGEHLP